MEDFREQVGAGPPAGTLQVTLFVPTVLVTSYVDPAVLQGSTLRELRRFLHRLGRESRQGEVGIVVGGNYYGITEFDHAKE